MASPSPVPSAIKRLQGKVALITGGASGIGECTAKLFAKHGAKVAIADIQDELGHSVVKSLGPSNSIFIHCDVSNEDHVKNAVDKTVSTFGKLDIMFNNAGIMDDLRLQINDQQKADFERILSVNVTGVFLGMKHAARVMVPAHRGTIISTASAATGIGGLGPHAYVCSKHAVVGLTKNLAVELGQFGIRVNCVSPGPVNTRIATKFFDPNDGSFERFVDSVANLKGATLKADDIADAALFLASDEAKYVSGQNLFVDGGFTLVNSALPLFKQHMV